MRQKNLQPTCLPARQATYNLQPNFGFTLIEVIVVMAMIALISTITIASFRTGEKNKRLKFSADIITNAIRNGQNFSLSSRQIANSNCVVAGRPAKEAVSYIIFFNTIQSPTLYGIDKCSTANVIETYPLNPQTRIRSPNGLSVNSIPVTDLQFKFTLPFASLTYSNSSSVNQGTFNTFTSAAIIVEHLDATAARTVSVDGISGRIGEQ